MEAKITTKKKKESFCCVCVRLKFIYKIHINVFGITHRTHKLEVVSLHTILKSNLIIKEEKGEKETKKFFNFRFYFNRLSIKKDSAYIQNFIKTEG